MDNANFSVLNKGLPSHLCLATGSQSCIDLAFSSPSLSPLLNWTVLNDLYGSDHYPTLIHCTANVRTPTRAPQWVIQRADWDVFQQAVMLHEESFRDVDAMVAHFTDAVITAANIAIPVIGGKLRRPPVPWWNENCARAVKARKKALSRLNRNPTIENVIEYKRARAKARRIMRNSQSTSWRSYISSLSGHTPSSVVWNKIRKIKGNVANIAVPYLLIGGHIEADPDVITEELTSHYENVSSSLSYSSSFLERKRRLESLGLDFKSDGGENYNTAFSMLELTSALALSKCTSPGPDGIHNLMLKYLPERALQFLLKLFNIIWQNHNFPTSWREAIVIPIPKEGKDRSVPSNYRPISLTSCVCKLLERMINRRLVWQLESRHLITPIQCGFRKHRSTLDHLVTLSTDISTAFALRQHLIAIFFDIDKAYDSTWRHGILRTLYQWGFRGHLPIFIRNLLSNRSFRVRIGSTLSRKHPLENGVPQGSILSVTLFAIAINGIASVVREPVKASLFVDDFAIYCSSTNINMSQRQLQLALNRLNEWGENTGFKFSPTKSRGMHFCRIHHLHNNPELFLGRHQLSFVDSTRFLGLHFDKTLTWRNHITYLQSRCASPLNLLRTLSGTSWGADRSCLLRLYKALVRSVLDYGCIVYGSAAPSSLRRLNSIHHAGIRISTGAFRTSRIECLLAEAGEPNLSRRRDMLLATYGAKISSFQDHPSRKALLYPKLRSAYILRPSLPSRNTSPKITLGNESRTSVSAETV